ncbi:MAG: hypothetical protein JNN28_17100, partial [Saprospiraceae bacterium]|nr:hypothetical protein [Saprospiraceae bacterium]
MKNILSALAILLCFFPLMAQNEAPVIQSLSLVPDWDNQMLSVQYVVTDTENDPLEISIQFSTTNGKTYSATGMVPVTGDVGFPVLPG